MSMAGAPANGGARSCLRLPNGAASMPHREGGACFGPDGEGACARLPAKERLDSPRAAVFTDPLQWLAPLAGAPLARTFIRAASAWRSVGRASPCAAAPRHHAGACLWWGVPSASSGRQIKDLCSLCGPVRHLAGVCRHGNDHADGLLAALCQRSPRAVQNLLCACRRQSLSTARPPAAQARLVGGAGWKVRRVITAVIVLGLLYLLAVIHNGAPSKGRQMDCARPALLAVGAVAPLRGP